MPKPNLAAERTAMHEVNWRADGILHVRLQGFWDDTALSAFVDAMHAAMRRKPRASFEGLCDIRDLQVQSPETVARLHGLLDRIRAAGMRRGAIVVTSALLKMQANRLADPSRTMFVVTVADGLAWIEAMRVDDLAVAA